ncbi:hypothetical protein [uncultured Psychroserpens sp.]|uniref:hypothetical protein n=1 Tax=uncultured Psychroserpens sp. TaxID=255436 RepID=UPI002606EA2C|nr:hypothetical protein [uncultured Psychroserpens sp.]
MKHLVITLALILASSQTFAQNTYLKIYTDDTPESVIMYPPGTDFELKTKEGYIVMKNNNTPKIFEIDDDYTLFVYPNYKESSDVFKLNKGKVELALTSRFSDKDPKEETLFIDDSNITSHQKITDSKINSGLKNLEFELSNGIMFKYTDGKYKAYFKKEENYLNIKGKYLIESKLGVLKLSFNPKNGQVWWVFEAKK